MSNWNSAVSSVLFCVCRQHLVQGWLWFDPTNLSHSSLSSEVWETFRQTATRTHIYFLWVMMLLSLSLLPHVAGGGEVRVETGLLMECWKGQFLPSSALPGQSRPWDELWDRGTIFPPMHSVLHNKPLVSNGTSRWCTMSHKEQYTKKQRGTGRQRTHTAERF